MRLSKKSLLCLGVAVSTFCSATTGPLFIGTVTMRGSGANCEAAVDDLIFHFNNDTSTPTSDETTTKEFKTKPAAVSACTDAGGTDIMVSTPDTLTPRPIHTVGEASEDTRCSKTNEGVYWTTVSVVFPCAGAIADVPAGFPDPTNTGE